MMPAAAGFIRFLGAYQNDRLMVAGRLAIHKALRSAGRFAANHTNGMKFGHVFGNA